MSNRSKKRASARGKAPSLEKTGQLTLEGAIGKCQEIVNNSESTEEEKAIHQQLAKWLMEVKASRAVAAKQLGRQKGPLAKVKGLSYQEQLLLEKTIKDQAIEAKYDKLFEDKMAMTLQMCQDAAMIAAHESLGMGPGRVEKFCLAYIDAVNWIAHLMNEDQDKKGNNDPSMMYTKAKVDEKLQAICGKLFKPWEIRYGEEKEASPLPDQAATEDNTN